MLPDKGCQMKRVIPGKLLVPCHEDPKKTGSGHYRFYKKGEVKQNGTMVLPIALR